MDMKNTISDEIHCDSRSYEMYEPPILMPNCPRIQ
jgi:hypothetical protein